jgi:hypothetical protein
VFVEERRVERREEASGRAWRDKRKRDYLSGKEERKKKKEMDY